MLIGISPLIQILSDLYIRYFAFRKAALIHCAVMYSDHISHRQLFPAGICHHAGAIILFGKNIAFLIGLQVQHSKEFHSLHLIRRYILHLRGNMNTQRLFLMDRNIILHYGRGNFLPFIYKTQSGGVMNGQRI